MPVTVDHEPLPADQLGLETVGQVLSHIRNDNRLVMQVLIDGEEPDLGRLGALKRSPLRDHTLYIETTDPRALAGEVLSALNAQIEEAERLRAEAVELLEASAYGRAMEKIGAYFSTWQHAQEAVVKTAALLRIDLSEVEVDGEAFADLLAGFTAELRRIKSILEQRDFTALRRTLIERTPRVTARWQAALRVMGS